MLLLIPLSPHPARADEPAIRVQMLDPVEAIRVSVPGPCALVPDGNRAAATERDALRWEIVRLGWQGIQVGSRTVAANRIDIVPRDSPFIYLNGARYRGGLTVVRDRRRLLVINRIPLEEYLKGVVPSEAEAEWPAETLKAQAILARTASLNQVTGQADHAYDATKTWPQLYGGILAERPATDQAVEATRGLVLVENGRRVQMYYHSLCGGHTEAVEQVWPEVHEPSLRGVPCPYCQSAPSYHWMFDMRTGDLVQLLARNGVTVGALTAVTMGPPNPSGRSASVTVVGSHGATQLSAIQLRTILGVNRLRSTRCTVRYEGTRWIFEGYGWGHGVGLCQWGAAELGRQGRTAAEILEFYYPGATVASLKA